MIEFLEQKPQQLDLQFVPRSKVGVPALGRDRMILLPVPIHAGFAQTGSRRNDHRVAGRVRRTGIEHRDVFRLEAGDPVRHGLQVVDHPHVGNPQRGGQLALVNDPGQVHRRAPPILDGPRTAKAGGLDRGRMLLEELLHNLVQSLIAAAGIRLQRPHLELPRVVLVDEGQACVRAADIARQDHAGVFHSQDKSGLALRVEMERRGPMPLPLAAQAAETK